MACWQWFLGFIVNLGIVSIALWPNIKEWLHKRRYRYILRQQILRELRDIHQSYCGKIEVYQRTCPKDWAKPDFKPLVPPHDILWFNTLTNLFEKSTYLSRKERNGITELLSVFRKGSYEKRSGGSVIDKASIYKIKELSKVTINIINSKIDNKKK